MSNISTDYYSFKCHATTGTRYPLDAASVATILVSISFNLVIAVLTIILNVLVMIVIYISPRLKSSSNFLLFNTAITDSLSGLLSAPMFSGNFLLVYTKRTHDCTLFTATILTIHFFALLSFCLILLVTVDRYIAIFKPYYYHERIATTRRKYGLVIGILWIGTGMIIAIPVSFGKFNVILFVEGVSFCILVVLSMYIHSKIYIRVHTVKGEIRKQANNQSGAWRQQIEHTRKQDFRIALLTFLMLASLVVCYIPYAIVLFSWLAGDDTDWLNVLNMWGFTFIALKSLLNPVIYCYSLEAIRNSVKNLLCGRARKTCLTSEAISSRSIELSDSAQKKDCGVINEAY